jgi:hypothetical protein
VITGADGPFPADQLSYLAWIRDASHHVLAGNLYDLVRGRGVFLHPMFSLSALALRWGASIQASYLLWAPVAVAVVAVGIDVYVRRFLDRPAWAVAGAVVLAIFFATPTVPLVHGLGIGSAANRAAVDRVAGETSASTLTWGYFASAIATGLMPVYLLAVERIIDRRRRRHGRAGAVAVASAVGLLMAWIHPWQAETVLVVVAAVVIWDRRWRSMGSLALPAAATVLPLVYYLALPRLSAAWRLGERTDVQGHGPVWAMAVVILPLAVPAALGADWERTRGNVGEQMLLVWPLASVLAFLILPTFPLHSLEGIGVPLAVLAVRAGLRTTARLAAPVAVAGVCLLTLPGLAYNGRAMHRQIRLRQQPFVLSASERQAMSYLAASPRPGGVLAGFYLGTAVPAFTGRTTWDGHPNWTPDFSHRAQTADALLSGRLPAAAARQLVASTRPGFLLAGCGQPGRMDLLLGPLVTGVHHFGCTTVFDVDPGAAR